MPLSLFIMQACSRRPRGADKKQTQPAKMLNLNPGLRDITHSITGGSIAAQGEFHPALPASYVLHKQTSTEIPPPPPQQVTGCPSPAPKLSAQPSARP